MLFYLCYLPKYHIYKRHDNYNILYRMHTDDIKLYYTHSADESPFICVCINFYLMIKFMYNYNKVSCSIKVDWFLYSFLFYFILFFQKILMQKYRRCHHSLRWHIEQYKDRIHFELKPFNCLSWKCNRLILVFCNIRNVCWNSMLNIIDWTQIFNIDIVKQSDKITGQGWPWSHLKKLDTWRILCLQQVTFQSLTC